MDSCEFEGFLQTFRVLGKIAFFVLRCGTELDSVEAKRVHFVVRDLQLMKKLKVNKESYLRCVGQPEAVQRSNQRSFQLVECEVLHESECVPPVDFSKSNLGDDFTCLKDSFYLKDPRFGRILVLRSHLYSAIRSFLRARGFVELMTPKLVDFGSEGGSQIFKVPTNEKDYYLVQSPQIFKQLAVNSGLNKVFQIGPIFRAEKFKTSRHANEALCLDVQLRFSCLRRLVLLMRDLLIHVSKVLNALDPKVLRIEKKDFAVVSHSQAVKLLKLEPNASLTTEDEFKLLKLSKKKFLFVTEYPFFQRTFYTFKNQSFDLLSSKGELSSGSVRQFDHRVLQQNLKSWNVSLNSLSYYLNSFRYGSQRSMGFGLGIDRLVMLLLDLQNIQHGKVFRNEQI